MKISVDKELIEICREILDQDWDLDTWAAHEADDWFQTENYEGGFDACENEFCFEKKDSQGELWFQFSLADVPKLVDGNISQLIITNQETEQAP